MRQVAFAQFRDHFAQYIVEAGDEQIVVTRQGRPVGIFTPIGVFTDSAADDDWFDLQLENDPRFLKKIEQSRASIRAGQGIPWDEIKREDDERAKTSTVAPSGM
jgi:antitoxin (DNA-binding transcriptional repressor) of toxin-antitoxin stability system